MASEIHIRTATPGDLALLPAIEASAAALFRDIPAVSRFADGGPSLSAEKQRDLCAAGTLWVATGSPQNTDLEHSDEPCAFIAAERIHDSVYIWELSVHADMQRRGLAGLLINAVADYAIQTGLYRVSLITERDVPWNGPTYRSKGFREVEYKALGPGHLEIIEGERAEGMDMS